MGSAKPHTRLAVYFEAQEALLTQGLPDGKWRAQLLRLKREECLSFRTHHPTWTVLLVLS